MTALRNCLAVMLLGFLPALPSLAQEQDLAQNFRISGTILDAVSGSRVTGATVSIAPVGNNRTSTSTSTAADGHFSFEHLAPGKYLLAATGKNYARQTFQQHDNFSTAIAVGDNLNSADLIFRVFPFASISGQVTDDLSEPVRDAQVLLFHEQIINGSAGIRRQGQTNTDDQGRYRFSKLPAGRYYVAVQDRPWYAQNAAPLLPTPSPVPDTNSGLIVRSTLRPIVEQNSSLDVVYPITYYPRETESAKAGTITVQPGEGAAADVVLHAVPALHFILTVPGTDLSRNAGMRVTQSTLDGQDLFLQTYPGSANQSGLSVGGLPPGHVTVGVDVNVPGPNGDERHSWRQDVDASRDTQIDLTQAPGDITVSGTVRVTGANGLPHPVVIGMRDTRGAIYNSQATQDGTFDFRNMKFKPGRYELGVLNLPGFFLRSLGAEGANVMGPNLDLRGPGPVRLNVEVSQGIGRIDGIAMRDGKPAAGAMVLVVPNDYQGGPSAIQRDQSDSDGTFTLAAVPPGHCTVIAVQDGWDQEWSNPAVLKSWLGRGEAIEVAPDGRYQVKVSVQ